MNQMRLPEFVVKRSQHDFSESVLIGLALDYSAGRRGLVRCNMVVGFGEVDDV
jgi:hypothetical protein